MTVSASSFPSKRDGWLVAVVWIACGVVVASAGLQLVGDEAVWARAALAAVLLGVAAFMLWVLNGTGYRIEERSLHVRGGPFRWRIPLDAIVSVTPTRNPLSSPALSLDRLRVTHRTRRGERGLMISPADKAGFLAALTDRCPHLVRTADGLTARG